MKISKIFKGIIGIGAVSGIAYTAYKLGEMTGEVNERFNQKYDEEDEPSEDEDEPPDSYFVAPFEIKYDEPDDECISPDNLPSQENHDECKSEITKNVVPLSSLHIDNLSEYEVGNILLWMIYKGCFFKSDIRLWFNIGNATVNKLCNAFIEAGYIHNEKNKKKLYCYLTKSDFYKLFQ